MKTNTPKFANLRTEKDLFQELKKLRTGEEELLEINYRDVLIKISYKEGEYTCNHYFISFDHDGENCENKARDCGVYTTQKAVSNFISNRM